MKIKTLLSLLGVATICLGGCQKPSQQSEGQQISIKGSDTMVHLTTAWAESYMKKHPEANVSVTGGGSGTGIAALINGTTTIAASSRSLKEEEVALANKNGVNPQACKPALDGISIVVNPANPVQELDFDQLRQIFNGAVTNWQQIGGENRPIILLSRESNSGTYVYFQEEVLKKDDYSKQALLMPSSAALIQSAEQDLGAIGYVGLGYAENSKAKMVKVKATPTSVAVTPTLETIKNGTYAISRPLFLYTNNQPTGAVKEFLDFVMGPEGQAIAKANGYIPIQ